MKAIVATRYGSPDVLQLRELEKPRPGANEILVKIHAATVNAGDSRMRSFTVPPAFWLAGRLALGVSKPRNPIFGMELAGEVEAVGAAVRRFRAGDRVFASTFGARFGAHAEYKCLSADGPVALIPSGVSYEQAVTLPTGAHTAMVFLKAADIRPGQRVLINGASGSVGTFGVQLAKSFGAEVTAVCSGRNAELARSLGADSVIDYTREDWTANGQVYDVIFDAVGKTTLTECKGLLKPDGAYLHTVMVAAGIKKLWYGLTTGLRVIGGSHAPSAA